MANPKWSSQSSGYETAIWAAKIVFCFLGVVSCGAAVRAAMGALASALPSFWASLRSWLAPQYLFVAVHFIILVIWKLSDQQQQHRRHLEQWAAEAGIPESEKLTKIESFEPPPAAGLPRKPSPEIWRAPPPTTGEVLALDPGKHSPSDASTESCESSTPSSAFEGQRSVQPEAETSIAMAEEEDEAAAAAAELENDSMEATWKAIMEKSSRPALTPPAPSSASHEDMNRRFDDFIKKNHEQIRLLSSRRQP
ncbi:hypothetical protein OPV22_034525 [Ensete ventricosum]|uniref:DUF4408 domain-containing protein n=1 Tax=Ensete ventricosum TaxID=4639 RepID=A0AAV8PX75_ENSVE|nr:hypothetical protein OPV22_034525 [Ensete ventricosum]